MTTEPLHHYLRARDLLATDPDAAAAALELAVGSQPNNPVIRANLDRFLDYESGAGAVALGLVRAELRRG